MKIRATCFSLPSFSQVPRSVLWLGILSSVVTSASAQTSSGLDAGAMRQRIEQSQKDFRLPQVTNPSSPIPPSAEQTKSSLNFYVKAFDFSGNRVLSSEKLSLALSKFVNRDLNMSGLQRAADAIAAAYRDAGWIARVYLPEQDVSSGVVTLHIVESMYAGLRFEGEPSKQVMRSELESYFGANQKEGAPLNARVIERALLLTDDLPGVSVAGTLAPGAQDGQTVLVLRTADESSVYGDVGLDNVGARSTGSTRFTANLNVNSVGGRGEFFGLNLLKTQGSEYSRLTFTVPDGYNGLRLGLNASAMSYKVIDGPGYNSAAQIQGQSGTVGIDWNYPLIRSRLQNLYFSGGLDNKTFYTKDTQVSADYETDSVRLALVGNHFDAVGGGGANSGSVQILSGRLTNMKAHAQLNTIDREYRKINYSLSRQQTLTNDHSLFVGLQGQYASQSLDSSEKFYVGGSQSVRAYPLSELGGERGEVWTTEWRWRMDAAWVFTLFADMGHVMSFPATGSDQKTSLWIRGRGASVSWQGPMDSMLKLTWAHRNGSNPRPTSTGSDSDGTLQLNRLWLTANLLF